MSKKNQNEAPGQEQEVLEEQAEQTAEAAQEPEAQAEAPDPLLTELEALKDQVAQQEDKYLRLAAEYDNFRKRSAKEKDAAFGNGVSFAVEKLLGVLDTLALAANAQTEDESYKKGVLMTLDKAGAAFSAMGVEEIEAQDKPFDPELHAAVMQQQAPEGVESGTVVQVLQKGYTYNGKVIRHAAVAVAQ